MLPLRPGLFKRFFFSFCHKSGVSLFPKVSICAFGVQILLRSHLDGFKLLSVMQKEFFAKFNMFCFCTAPHSEVTPSEVVWVQHFKSTFQVTIFSDTRIH